MEPLGVRRLAERTLQGRERLFQNAVGVFRRLGAEARDYEIVVDAARAHQNRARQGPHVRLGTVGDARAPHSGQAPRHGQSFFARFSRARPREDAGDHRVVPGVRRVDGVGAGQRNGVDQ